MIELTARCIKLDTYRDIGKIIEARDELIKNRKSTRDVGLIYDYEEMIDDCVFIASQLLNKNDSK